MAETQPKVQPAALSLSAMISQYFIARLSLGHPERRPVLARPLRMSRKVRGRAGNWR
jgi:hypothetical protein